MVLFQTKDRDCILNNINEAYAFAQSFEITIAIVAIMVLFAKIAAIHYDTKQENKLAFRLHLVFLLWALAYFIKWLGLFFVDPADQYDSYIRPLAPYPVSPLYNKEDTADHDILFDQKG